MKLNNVLFNLTHKKTKKKVIKKVFFFVKRKRYFLLATRMRINESEEMIFWLSLIVKI
jgi:hypothetical protein